VVQFSFKMVTDKNKELQDEIGRLNGTMRDLQYLTMAMIESGNIDKAKVDKIAEEMKLKDFNEASDKEDKEKGLTVIDTVEADSTIIITSDCLDNKDQSLFRSKFSLVDANHPELVEKIVGKKVGDQVEITLNEKKHMVTLLAIRKPAPEVKPEPKAETPAPEVTA